MNGIYLKNELALIVLAITSILLIISIPVYAESTDTQSPAAVINLDQIKNLVGEWIGEGGGDPGQGVGGFSFNLDLQGNIMIRKNYTEYPAIKEKPAYRHDDFMVLFQEDTSSPMKAIYWDSEGHVINYTVEISADSNSIIFVSEKSSNGPRFRLTYIKIDANNVRIIFEIAPPNKPDEFSKYIEASARRK